MRIDKLTLQNFKRFDYCELALNGKSTVIFGKTVQVNPLLLRQ